MIRIFLQIKSKCWAYLGPVICKLVLNRSRILRSSSYSEKNKQEAGTVQDSPQDWDSWLNKSYQISLKVCLKYLLRVELLTTDNFKTFTCIRFSQQYFWLFSARTYSIIRSRLKVMMTLFWCFNSLWLHRRRLWPLALCNSWQRLALLLRLRGCSANQRPVFLLWTNQRLPSWLWLEEKCWLLIGPEEKYWPLIGCLAVSWQQHTDNNLIRLPWSANVK